MNTEMKEMQNHFQAYLFGKRRTMSADIVGRMNVYREAYTLRLTDILKSDFPAIFKVMGRPSFIRLAKQYIRHHPSTFFSAADFGCLMAEFLATVDPYRNKPALSDLAKFEWALSRSITLPDAAVLTREQVVNIPQASWPHIVFAFHPSVQTFALHWNVPEVWHAVIVEKKPYVFTPLNETIYWSVWRKGLEPFYRKHTTETYFIVQALERGCTFAEICEGLSAFVPVEKIAETAVSTLSLWMEDSMLTGYTIKEGD